jgi:type 1 glutamine amidotransferase
MDLSQLPDGFHTVVFRSRETVRELLFLKIGGNVSFPGSRIVPADKRETLIPLGKVSAQKAVTDTLVFERAWYVTKKLGVDRNGPSLAVELDRVKSDVLIVTGIGWHQWELIQHQLTAILEHSNLFNVTITQSPPEQNAPGWDEWRPVFSDYDLVLVIDFYVIDGTFSRWPREVETALADYVRGGGGLFAFHALYDGMAGYEELPFMLGMNRWPEADGNFTVRIGSNGEIIKEAPSQGAGHGERLDVPQTALAQDHPILDGYPASWRSKTLEVFYGLRGPCENMTVLTYANEYISNEDKPVQWTVQYGEGRVYVSTEGHMHADFTDPMRDVAFQANVIRAGEWLATGEVTYPVPDNFPDPDAVSLNPESSLQP